jgi:hypothetical protein
VTNPDDVPQADLAEQEEPPDDRAPLTHLHGADEGTEPSADDGDLFEQDETR